MVQILFIDNHTEVADLLKQHLKELIQMDILVVPSVPEALDLIQSISPDLVFFPVPLSWQIDIPEIIRLQENLRGLNNLSSIYLYNKYQDGLVLLDISYGVNYFNIHTSDIHYKILSSIREVTNRGRLERSLREDYDHNNRVISKMPLSFLEVDNGVITRINQVFLDLTGFEEFDIIGKTSQEFIKFDEDFSYDSIISDYKKPVKINGEVRDKNGNITPCRIIINLIEQRKGLDGLWFIENRIEYKKLCNKLKETEYECREQLYLSETLIIRLQSDGIITFANPAASRCFGYENDGLIGVDISNLFPAGIMPDSTEYIDFLSDAADESSASVHIFEHCRKDNKRLWIAWNSKGLYSTTGDLNGLICIGTDMTEHATDGHERISTRIWRDRILENTDILPDVFDAVLQSCMEIGREGREGKPIGTSFIVGDDNEVLHHSRQLILNPFYGHPDETRSIISSDVREMLKEYAMLDGAFVISGKGILQAAGRYITLDTSSISLPKGMGTRHSSTAALTSVTNSIGFVVSESGGKVSIMKEGKIIKVIA